MSPASAPTLEQKIVKALTDEAIASNDHANLLAETETAIAIAENDATVAEAAALDPLQSPDPVKARAVMEDARFKADRMRSLLPRLQSRYEEVIRREEGAAWIAEYETLKPKRDVLAEEVKTVYAAFVAKFVPLLRQIDQVNAEVSRLCQSKPSRRYEDGDDGRWLSDIPTLADLKLPDPDKPKKMAWPKPVSYFSPGIVPILGSPGGDWWKAQQAEDARKRAEALRIEAELQQAEGRNRDLPAKAADDRMRERTS
jgi:hypothetical protein